ncbi:sulfurtransferase [Cyclobacterium jeungdonense]|uniref:Sulfurtransferase n=1 Tax=Cyclobacterium jeungdonense TaxID=708087 RepID=A0ABT8CAB4_9BACT|nr:sulfurtransferase [Cyclobacterium jeungdonense]MDN3689316.1 sulfurtransferase [Cyclobacterium jeungdonense]
MNSELTPLIPASTLLELLDQPSLVVIDAGFGKEKYLQKHLLGALFVDLNRDLSSIKEDPAEGGRHPLPDPAEFGKTLGKLGISPESRVVIYDDKQGAMSAARLWWMLRAMGHQNVQVLDGGMQAAEAAGYPMGSGEESNSPTVPYPASEWQLPLADLDEVAKKVNDPAYRVIDVRESARYLGETEPIDLIAGHIPGAINVPFGENLDSKGYFLPAETLKKNYSEVLAAGPAENTLVHCGSGVTACHTLLALAHAGLEIPKLYVGSWSEWSRNNRPVAKGNE